VLQIQSLFYAGFQWVGREFSLSSPLIQIIQSKAQHATVAFGSHPENNQLYRHVTSYVCNEENILKAD
jgi:hypothetical protein